MIAYERWSHVGAFKCILHFILKNVYNLSFKGFGLCFSTLKRWKNRVKSRPSVLCRHADKLKTMLNKMRPSERLLYQVKSSLNIKVARLHPRRRNWPNYPVWMTQKPKKGDFGKLKSKKISHWDMPPDPAKAWAFGARLGNRSVLILDPRLLRVFVLVSL